MSDFTAFHSLVMCGYVCVMVRSSLFCGMCYGCVFRCARTKFQQTFLSPSQTTS